MSRLPTPPRLALTVLTALAASGLLGCGDNPSGGASGGSSGGADRDARGEADTTLTHDCSGTGSLEGFDSAAWNDLPGATRPTAAGRTARYALALRLTRCHSLVGLPRSEVEAALGAVALKTPAETGASDPDPGRPSATKPRRPAGPTERPLGTPPADYRLGPVGRGPGNRVALLRVRYETADPDAVVSGASIYQYAATRPRRPT